MLCLEENILVCVLVRFINCFKILLYSTKAVFSEVVFWSSFISCLIFSTDVSSAYIIVLSCVRCGISFVY
jgi:hypothetical protein